jgi:hypothetical protein
MLMRETVACSRLKRKDLSAAGWKAVLSAVLRLTVWTVLMR